MDGVEIIGLAASVLTTLAYLPQVAKTWRTRSAHDFSLPTLLMLEVGVGLWMLYGIMRAAPAVWFGNGLTLALAGFILAVKIGQSRSQSIENGQQRRTGKRSVTP